MLCNSSQVPIDYPLIRFLIVVLLGMMRFRLLVAIMSIIIIVVMVILVIVVRVILVIVRVMVVAIMIPRFIGMVNVEFVVDDLSVEVLVSLHRRLMIVVDFGRSVALGIDSLGATAIVTVFLTMIVVIAFFVVVFLVRWALCEVGLFVPRAPVSVRVDSFCVAPFLTTCLLSLLPLAIISSLLLLSLPGGSLFTSLALLRSLLGSSLSLFLFRLLLLLPSSFLLPLFSPSLLSLFSLPLLPLFSLLLFPFFSFPLLPLFSFPLLPFFSLSLFPFFSFPLFPLFSLSLFPFFSFPLFPLFSFPSLFLFLPLFLLLPRGGLGVHLLLLPSLLLLRLWWF